MQKIRAFLPVVVLSLGMVATVAVPAQGQDLAGPNFDHTEFAFGTIARGAKAEHHFPFKNLGEQDVHVKSLQSTCNCTTPTLSQATLKKGETAEIVATLDTRSKEYIGARDATITVKFDKPPGLEVRLRVTGYIRGDVVVQPDVVQFDAVPAGDGAERKVKVSYAPGRLDWKITAVEYPQSLNVEYKETGRAANQVDYDLTVKLKKDAPAGYFKDQIVVLTDDAAQARLFVPVEGNVAASIALTSPLLVGVLAPGATATRSLVVRNKTPFRVLGVQCADPRFTFNLPDGAAALQKIGVNFKATGAIGAVTQKITIETDAPGGEALEATVQARITPWGAKDAVSAEATPFVPQGRATLSRPE